MSKNKPFWMVGEGDLISPCDEEKKKNKKKLGKCMKMVTINVDETSDDNCEKTKNSKTLLRKESLVPNLNTDPVYNVVITDENNFYPSSFDGKKSSKRPSYMRDSRQKMVKNNSKSNKKLLRFATVVAYIIAVSLAAVALAAYYTFVWRPGKFDNLCNINLSDTHKTEST